MSPSTSANGKQLFADVQRYYDFGIHRTGTECDHRTANWIAERLAALDLDVTSHDVTFDRWVSTSKLLAGRTEVLHLPVPYEWQGSLTTNNVHVESIDPVYGGFPDALDGAIAAARRGGAEAVVLCTEHPNGSLVAQNRDLSAVPSNFPTLLAAGRDHDLLAASRVQVELSATTEPATTVNVVAANGLEGDPLVLTTPLTGWFGCAGERGTGVAVLLHLAERFKDIPLIVVATGGHELTWFGAQQWVTECHLSLRGVVHVGASVAVEEDSNDGRRLARTRVALTSIDDEAAKDMTNALKPANLTLRTNNESWMGEGKSFARLQVPLLSFSGAGVDFHCPEDTPQRATSPHALETVANAIAKATAHLVDAIDRSSRNAN